MSTAAANGQGEPLVEVRDLTKHFPITKGIVFQKQVGAVRAVDGVSFDVHRGEALGIVGETGCGKSTTARLLTRLLDPTSGSIKINGNEIADLSRRQLKPLRRDVQMIFQDPYSSLNPRKTVGAVIAEPFIIHGLNKGEGERRKAVQGLMEQVGLNPEHYNRYPHQFSGGQRQRIGVARALALQPKMIIADEPVSALDVSIQAQILNLLRDLQREYDLTLVLISHDLSVVRHMCDRVAVMYLGKIVEIAESDALYLHPQHPYTGALLSAVPVPDPVLAQRKQRAVPGGDVPSPSNPPPACRFHTRCPKMQQICAEQEPPLEQKAEGDMAACHFPLTEEEAAERTGRRPAAA
jgi:peptide/nickel transport system ATP-binding protein/oligopeptide transport system ATP-binding protein